MFKHCVAFVTIALAFVPLPARAAEEPDHAVHEELRGLMRTAQQAISAGKFDDALPVLAENPRLTPITQEFLDSNAAYSAYFNKYFGANFLDNPVLSEFEQAVKKYSISGVVLGLAVGAAVGFFLGRRRKGAA